MCLNMIRKFLREKQVTYNAFFWKVGMGKRISKEIFFLILYPFALNFILPNTHTVDFKIAY